MNSPAIFVYRNCFTGDVSGGDMHTGGVSQWIAEQHPTHPLYLIHAQNDGQDIAYPETARLQQITYPDTKIQTPSLMFPLRALKGSQVSLLTTSGKNILIAGSHFLPDVWPAVRQGKKMPKAIRVVYIHHIVQDMPRPKTLNTRLANLQEQLCFSLIKRHFDKIITVNQAVVDGLRKRGFEQPILLSSNFVNAHQQQSIPYNAKDITIAFCGRLVPQKGIDAFLDTCEALQARMPHFRAVMIGAGPEQTKIQKRINEQRLQVEVAGFVSETRKFHILAHTKLLVMPSIEEGWGIAIAESFSAGTPVLAYDLPVYNEPFGGSIKTVPLHDRKQLIRSVADLLAGWEQQPAPYAALQIQLVNRAKDFSTDRVSAKEFAFITEDQHA